MADASETNLEIVIRRGDGKVEAIAPERLDELDTIVADPGTIACLHVTSPSDQLMDQLAREFRLHPLPVEDLRKRRQRPKIDMYGDRHMIVVYQAWPALARPKAWRRSTS